MNYFKPISISLSPNIEKDDLRLALNLLIRPFKWRRGSAVEELEKTFRKYLGVKHAISFNSGRSSLYAILKALNLKNKVLLQAFTCNAVPNPVLWAGMEPVYVDCDPDNFNINFDDLDEKISQNPEAKILIIQHTFGLPADMGRIQKICQEKDLILVEDCAHALGAEFNGRKVGTFGKASFFSFSRDKVISSVYGGMAVTNDDELGEALLQAQGKFGMPSACWSWQQIWHPILLHYFILPIYNFIDLGKIFLVLAQSLHILSKAVNWKEKRGQRPDYFPRALPNALAIMALNQFSKLGKFESARHNLFNYYSENLKDSDFTLPQNSAGVKQSWLRYTIKTRRAHEIIYETWHKQNILLGDWYTTPIAPFDTRLENLKYVQGSCPNAEYLAKNVLNLPTHINITKKDADRIIKFLKNFK